MQDPNVPGDDGFAYLSLREAAVVFGVTPETIRERIDRGELIGIKSTIPSGFMWLVKVPVNQLGEGWRALRLPGLREEFTELEILVQELRQQAEAWRMKADTMEGLIRRLQTHL
jgi:hypothetical protein